MKWETVKLVDICEVCGGTTPKTNIKEYWNGTNIWLSPVDLPEVGSITMVETSERKITDLGIKESGLRVLPVGSLVFSTRASIGKIGIVKKPLTTNQGFTNLIPSDRVNVRYLAYALKKSIPDIEQLGNTTTFKEVSRTAIKNFKIPLPPLRIQEQIADTLDKADALRRKDQELLQKYDQLAQSIFYDMFGDPVRNEKGWKTSTLKGLINIDTKSVKPEDTVGRHYVGLENIEKESGNVTQSKEVDLKSNKFHFDPTCILYGKLRPYLRKVATPNFDGVCSTDIFPIRCKGLEKEFAATILRSEHFTDYANSSSVGANLPRVNKEVILSYETICPPMRLQENYSVKKNQIK